ncbi:MAG: hypothetical protein A6F71_09775 [Cycloclasticus sp. symbiont of Poecilosclerida sp. M]|nr:MAG: hypothetical protein A6F71_09775 [Cycloclasticus sp. symbiont of Poecilosclerida sp. M]
MDLRQVNDGHVLTIRSIQGHMIRLTVQGGRVVLELSEAVEGSGLALNGSDTGGGGVVNGAALQEGVFTPVVRKLSEQSQKKSNLSFHLYGQLSLTVSVFGV